MPSVALLSGVCGLYLLSVKRAGEASSEMALEWGRGAGGVHQPSALSGRAQ